MTNRPPPSTASANVPETAEEEAALVASLKAGHTQAYELAVRAYSPRLLAVITLITPADADDVLQETFLSAFRAIAAFDGRAKLGTWLHRIAVNAALMHKRRQKGRSEVSIDALQPEFENGRFTSRPVRLPPSVTSEGVIDIEQREQLLLALAQLPEEFRLVVMMRDAEGMESKAVAAALGISDALVRQRLHRGRVALVKLLTPAHGADRSPRSELAR